MLVCEVLDGARRQRGKVRGVIVHIDRGSQYASADYRHARKALTGTASMSRKANCNDNAAMESFWSTLKTELFGDTLPATRAQARTMIFESIEIFTTAGGSTAPSALLPLWTLKTTLTILARITNLRN